MGDHQPEPVEGLQRVLTCFENCDKDKCGIITLLELSAVLKGLGFTEGEAEYLISLSPEAGASVSYVSFLSKVYGQCDAASEQKAAEEEEDTAPGLLHEGPYVWRPSVPVKTFNAKFAELDEEVDAPDSEVQEITLTAFLGSGAEGTVYEGRCAMRGKVSSCAVKFAGAFPDHSPRAHAAVDMLANVDTPPSQAHESELRALRLLRPRTEAQWQSLACGPVRLNQLYGFHETTGALILELCEGRHPSGDVVPDSVKDFLQQVKKLTGVEVGDVKCENLIQDSCGAITVIDFGKCSYSGRAFCKRCNADVEDVDVHAQEHVAEYIQAQRKRGPISRLRLQEFCYGKAFC
eukprot:TRINITY_DN63634_c0_g1_i1.p1 TRINITY_DN63634_c0_g1~~TRINITY_DN63634_c0_g1_i1.p1  ORF type:complete len:362 (+),score=64.77 TRINITY_DN63634_c0_g1_i1:44-1087(+)